jgi:hypothetical protein
VSCSFQGTFQLARKEYRVALILTVWPTPPLRASQVLPHISGGERPGGESPAHVDPEEEKCLNSAANRPTGLLVPTDLWRRRPRDEVD